MSNNALTLFLSTAIINAKPYNPGYDQRHDSINQAAQREKQPLQASSD
ncbi:hypothetical protein [Bacillus sp. FJAT-27264]|nr:hypothetical protein [Bacillus sp. FJAT-27264]